VIERKIKDLAIACEAMSRVGDLYNEAYSTKQLLQAAIKEAEQIEHNRKYDEQLFTTRPPNPVPTLDDIPC
jgi:hypothetical protein